MRFGGKCCLRLPHIQAVDLSKTFISNFVFECPCILDKKIKGRPTRCKERWFIGNQLFLNLFRASLRPSSGEQTACHCLWCSVLVVAVVVPESRVARCAHYEEYVAWLAVKQHTFHSAHISLPDSPEPQRLQPGQNTTGSDTQSALLMMDVKTPGTSWGTIDCQ